MSLKLIPPTESALSLSLLWTAAGLGGLSLCREKSRNVFHWPLTLTHLRASLWEPPINWEWCLKQGKKPRERASLFFQQHNNEWKFPGFREKDFLSDVNAQRGFKVFIRYSHKPVLFKTISLWKSAALMKLFSTDQCQYLCPMSWRNRVFLYLQCQLLFVFIDRGLT